MQDDLQKAYTAYQQALYHLPNPKVIPLIIFSPQSQLTHSNSKEDPKLWYGIGILYDRYGSLDHAEEAFSSVLRMDKGISGCVLSQSRLSNHFPHTRIRQS